MDYLEEICFHGEDYCSVVADHHQPLWDLCHNRQVVLEECCQCLRTSRKVLVNLSACVDWVAVLYLEVRVWDGLLVVRV